jgi:hypothetical protein
VAVKSRRRSSMTAAASSHRVAVHNIARRKYKSIQTSVGDETPSSKREYPVVRNNTTVGS